MFTSWPEAAFVAGVTIGSGSRLDSTRAAGSACPQTARWRDSPSSRIRTDSRERPLPPAASRGVGTRASGRRRGAEQVVRDDLAGQPEPERRQAGEDAALVGDLGRKDDVEGRDPVGGDEQQPLVVERVQLAHLSAREVDGSVRQGRAPPAVRAGGRTRRRRSGCTNRGRRRREVDRSRDLGVRPDELGKVETLVPRPHRVALDEPVRVVPRAPRLDERQQQPLAEVEAVARVQVLAHPLRPDDEPLDEPGEAVEHVVDGEEGIRQDDPLRRRECEMSRSCQSATFSRPTTAWPRTTRARPQIRSERSGCACAASPKNPSGRSRTALPPRASVRARPELEREPLQRRREQRERVQHLGVPVALQDLRRARGRLEPEPLAGDLLDLRVGGGGADGAGELADPNPPARAPF